MRKRNSNIITQGLVLAATFFGELVANATKNVVATTRYRTKFMYRKIPKCPLQRNKQLDHSE